MCQAYEKYVKFSLLRYDHVLSLKQLLNLFKYLQSQDKQAAYYPCHYK